ncbi:MAG: hypothetical protein ACT4P4_14260 [Betaproteobacteria bacterium]
MDAKAAIAKAHELAHQYFSQEFNTAALRLEEVELSDDGEWLITLSMPRRETVNTIFGPSLKETDMRSYKVFRFSRASGDFKSMKIREFK